MKMTIIYDGIEWTLSSGYYRKTINYKCTKLHVYIWEKYNNTKVPDGYVIHHKDHNKLNNNIDNLVLMERGEHTVYHNKNLTIEQKKRRSLCKLGEKNPRFGIKEDQEHAKERGILISLAKLKDTTQEMQDDINNGMQRKEFLTKHNVGRCIYDRLRTGRTRKHKIS